MENLTPTVEGAEAENTSRLHPKVRMVLDGENPVNLVRSEISASVQVQYDEPLEKDLVLDMNQADLQQRAQVPGATEAALDAEETAADEVAAEEGAAEEGAAEEGAAEEGAAEEAHAEEMASAAEAGRVVAAEPRIPEPTISVFVQLATPSKKDGSSQTLLSELPGEIGRVGDLVTADVDRSQLHQLAGYGFVSRVEPGEPVKHPRPALGAVSAEEQDRPDFLDDTRLTDINHRNGADVLVGIIDVEGFDFAHPDFLDDQGNTRFVSIWDQGGAVRGSPPGFPYGSEFREEHLRAAMEQSQFDPTRFEPQSVMKRGSHGTHVASIAAGNSGICSEAEIAGVLIALDDRDMDRRRSLYDSTRIAHGLLYLNSLARQRGKQLVVNISLGTNGHAHDASSPTSRWLDALLVEPGRAVCVAAGNAGKMEPEHDRDFGYVMGRVHCHGQIAAAGLRREIEWNVVGDGLEDISENEMEIWYPAQDRFAVQVKPPGGLWSKEVEPRQYLENHPLPDGTRLSIYNELYHTANGANHISIYLSPFLDPAVVKGVTHGTWKVRLIGREIRNGTFDCWIERDDPRPLTPAVAGGPWRFPSFFGPTTYSKSSTVSSLACGQRVVSVANHDRAAESINPTSSLGPTRDGRDKPDIAAPGTDVVAARGFAREGEDLWIAMSGTSMASPHVAGVTGLMLTVEPKLTAAQVVGIIRRTAQPLPGADFDWQRDAGFGIIDAAAAVVEACNFTRYTDLDKATVAAEGAS